MPPFILLPITEFLRVLDLQKKKSKFAVSPFWRRRSPRWRRQHAPMGLPAALSAGGGVEG